MEEQVTAVLIFGSILGTLIAIILIAIYEVVYVNRKLREPFASLGWKFQRLDASHSHLSRLLEEKPKRYKAPAIDTTGLQIYHKGHNRHYASIILVEKNKEFSIESQVS